MHTLGWQARWLCKLARVLSLSFLWSKGASIHPLFSYSLLIFSPGEARFALCVLASRHFMTVFLHSKSNKPFRLNEEIHALRLYSSKTSTFFFASKKHMKTVIWQMLNKSASQRLGVLGSLLGDRAAEVTAMAQQSFSDISLPSAFSTLSGPSSGASGLFSSFRGLRGTSEWYQDMSLLLWACWLMIQMIDFSWGLMC